MFQWNVPEQYIFHLAVEEPIFVEFVSTDDYFLPGLVMKRGKEVANKLEMKITNGHGVVAQMGEVTLGKTKELISTAKMVNAMTKELDEANFQSHPAANGTANPLIVSHEPTKGPQIKTKPKKRLVPAVSENHQITEFFPIRRSERRTRTKIKKEKQKAVEEAILTGREDGLRVEKVDGKGRAVFTCTTFKRGDYVVEYSGELIGLDEARRREFAYSQDMNTGCYMYYFKHNNRRYCIDATKETERLGRLVNHSRLGNLVTKSFVIGSEPHLILVASRDIDTDEELLYDYGDRSKSSLEAHPWLAS